MNTLLLKSSCILLFGFIFFQAFLAENHVPVPQSSLSDNEIVLLPTDTIQSVAIVPVEKKLEAR
ncbi:MAG: hypothetical protein AAF960_12130 [Bacteroidota bacterium]